MIEALLCSLYTFLILCLHAVTSSNSILQFPDVSTLTDPNFRILLRKFGGEDGDGKSYHLPVTPECHAADCIAPTDEQVTTYLKKYWRRRKRRSLKSSDKFAAILSFLAPKIFGPQNAGVQSLNVLENPFLSISPEGGFRNTVLYAIYYVLRYIPTLIKAGFYFLSSIFTSIEYSINLALNIIIYGSRIVLKLFMFVADRIANAIVRLISFPQTILSTIQWMYRIFALPVRIARKVLRI